MEKPQDPPPQTSGRDGFETPKDHRRAYRREKRKNESAAGDKAPDQEAGEAHHPHRGSIPNAKRRTKANLILMFMEPTSQATPTLGNRRGNLILHGPPLASCTPAPALAQRNKRGRHEVTRVAVADEPNRPQSSSPTNPSLLTAYLN